MRTIVHLSDLHFGRTEASLYEPLLAAVGAAKPDLVVVSGDLTQRARVWQFRQAHAFLERLTAPILVVPGNHDVPLDNPILRAFAPWTRYRRWISEDLEPSYEDDELVVAGLNTVTPRAWQRGRIKERQVAHLCAIFERSGDADRTRVVVGHHPFAQSPDDVRKAPTRGARSALARLAACGADIFLTGHLHAWHASPSDHAVVAVPDVLLVQAGTGLSDRLRDEVNSFNLLRVSPRTVAVERIEHVALERVFRAAQRETFSRGASGWTRSVSQ
ncbi:MAG: hypothetical protein BGO51_10105 [Rhodospirillales bacterium 69-11]|jgi:3',5'-cyclic AMP phosphodiesterase CpdA|nr:metallophosphoesterase [Rhodospirillales bacterium]OJW21900.1 MAG: hypothetical protein BGO51_10105 [Rhodospirillales bacterium 69-11]